MINLSIDENLEILLNLNIKDIFKLSKTNKLLNNITNNDTLWKKLTDRDFKIYNMNNKNLYKELYYKEKSLYWLGQHDFLIENEKYYFFRQNDDLIVKYLIKDLLKNENFFKYLLINYYEKINKVFFSDLIFSYLNKDIQLHDNILIFTIDIIKKLPLLYNNILTNLIIPIYIREINYKNNILYKLLDNNSKQIIDKKCI